MTTGGQWTYIHVHVAAPLFLWKKKELSSGVVACICLVSITDYSCRLLSMTGPIPTVYAALPQTAYDKPPIKGLAIIWMHMYKVLCELTFSGHSPFECSPQELAGRRQHCGPPRPRHSRREEERREGTWRMTMCGGQQISLRDSHVHTFWRVWEQNYIHVHAYWTMNWCYMYMYSHIAIAQNMTLSIAGHPTQAYSYGAVWGQHTSGHWYSCSVVHTFLYNGFSHVHNYVPYALPKQGNVLSCMRAVIYSNYECT